MLVSWLLSAAFPMSGIRSLLSSEGLRWLMGHFSHLLATPLLVWLLLCAMAWGCLLRSGLLVRPTNYRERRAKFMALLLMAVIVGFMLLLTAIPHAVLLSAVGGLWPSPFSASLVPVVAFSVTLVSAFYGLVSGRFENISAVYDAILQGIRQGAPFSFSMSCWSKSTNLSCSCCHLSPLMLIVLLVEGCILLVKDR